MKKLILICLFLILLTSCVKDIVNVSDAGRKITINGFITTDKLLNVRISRSVFITDDTTNEASSLYSIDNADVVIYKDNTVIDSLYFNMPWVDLSSVDNIYQNGNYVSRNQFPITGKEYKVVVKAPGLTEASATTTIPDLVRIEHVDTSRVIVASQFSNTNICLKCNIEFTDPSNETNYYLFNIYRYNKEDGSERSECLGFLCTDPIAEEKLISKMGGWLSSNPIEGIAFTDKIINGRKSNFAVTILCNDIGLPFYEDDHNYMEDGNHKKIIYFKLYSITEEYYKYIQTLNQYSKSYDNPLSDPVLVYSNVTSGYGIFAGAALSSDSLVFTY